MAWFDTGWQVRSFHLGVPYAMRVSGHVNRISPTRIRVEGVAELRQETGTYGFERIDTEIAGLLGRWVHKPRYTGFVRRYTTWGRNFAGEFEVGTDAGNFHGDFHGCSVSQGNKPLSGEQWLGFDCGYPIGATPPTGLSVKNIRTTDRTVTATVTVDNWGNGANNGLYKELQVGTANNTANQYFWYARGWDRSSDITVSSSSNKRGDIDLTPNTKYYLGLYAHNGVLESGSQFPNVTAVTLATGDISASAIKPTSISFDVTATEGYRVPSVAVQYRKKGREEWRETAAISGTTGDISVTKLIPYADYEFRAKVSTTDGVWLGETIVARTKPNIIAIFPNGTKRYASLAAIYPTGERKNIARFKKIKV